MKKKKAKRTTHAGTENPNAKLNWTAVTRIRKCPNIPAKQLAEQYGVHVATIYSIRLGRIWKESSRPSRRK